MKRSERNQARRRKRYSDAPGWVQRAATTDGLSKRFRSYRDRQLGTMGGAGPCRRIDPKTGNYIE